MKIHKHIHKKSDSLHPVLEVADIFRIHQKDFLQNHSVTLDQLNVMRNIISCRTESLGGHLDFCPECNHERPSYNSCRDRHCPKCQSLTQKRWIEKRMQRILPTRYFHVVFTLPSILRPIALLNKRLFYNILFHTASKTLLDLANDTKRLGAQLGITAVLHTWTRNLQFHPHLHCIVTGGGLNILNNTWISTKGSRYLFPVKVISSLFQKKFLSSLTEAFNNNLLFLNSFLKSSFNNSINKLYSMKWVVYAKAPFRSTKHVFEYLGRYTHRTGISNHRLISMDEKSVTFYTKNDNSTSMPHHVFIKRFLFHVLPKGFFKIRHFGLFSSCNVNTRLKTARALLESQITQYEKQSSNNNIQDISWQQLMFSLTGFDPALCPKCGYKRMITIPLIYCDRLNQKLKFPYDDSS